jgi:hypothetical protein
MYGNTDKVIGLHATKSPLFHFREPLHSTHFHRNILYVSQT